MNTTPDPRHHVVTITTTVEDGDHYLDTISCECTAPDNAPCRTYPDCQCELFTQDDDNPGHDDYGHPYETGQPCWLKQWFDADLSGESTIYQGPDHTDYTPPSYSRTGHIELVEFDEAPVWRFIEPDPEAALDGLAGLAARTNQN